MSVKKIVATGPVPCYYHTIQQEQYLKNQKPLENLLPSP